MRIQGWTCAVALIAFSVTPGPTEAATIAVEPGGDLQAAINAAKPGDTIELAAGAEFVGSFVLPDKPGDGYIVIRSSTPLGLLPGPGARITPAHAPLLARLRSPTDMPAIRTAPGAHHWRLEYLEFAANRNGYGEIIRLGDGSGAQNSLGIVPHHFILSHLYVHGDLLTGQKRGIAANVSHFEIRDSYISEIKAVGQDTQAICAWNGPGPFLIENNYLEAAGENVLFGGADPSISNLVAENIVIRRNFFSRPMSWMQPIVGTPGSVQAAAQTGGSLAAGAYAYRVFARRLVGQTTIGRSSASVEVAATVVAAGGSVRVRWNAVPDATEYRVYGRSAGAQNIYWRVTGTEFVDTGGAGTAELVPTTAGSMWTVKNLFELKNARGVLIEANIFQNHWKHAQAGYAIVYTPRNSGGTCPWCTVENVTFQYNVVRNVAAGINVLVYDNTAPSAQSSQLIFRQNLFHDVKKALGGNAWFMIIGGGPRDITVEHNTIDSDGTTVVNIYGGTSTDPEEVNGFRMAGNAARHGSYGMGGSFFTFGNGILTNYYPGHQFDTNYLAGAAVSRYPTGTLVSGVLEAQFVNAPAKNYAIRTDSPLYRAAPDGTDVGVDFDALMSAIEGVENGAPGTPLAAPVAGFTVSCANLACSFADASSDADGSIAGWAWDFADGSSSTHRNPGHTFPAPGTYEVRLTVTDDDGIAASTVQAVTVTSETAPPVAAFTVSCAGFTCTLSDSSSDADGSIRSWSWTFGDGTGSTLENPTKTFASAGTYVIGLTVEDDRGATASATRSVTVGRGKVHIGNLDATVGVAGDTWSAAVTVAVHGVHDQPIAGAVVKFKWWDGFSGSGTCTTNSLGQCTVSTGSMPLAADGVKLSVRSVTSDAGPYRPMLNHDADGDSNGTAIKVRNPMLRVKGTGGGR